jgi:hypothetical protein
MSEQSPRQRNSFARHVRFAEHGTGASDASVRRFDPSLPARPRLQLVRPESGATTLNEGKLKDMYRRHGHSVFRYVFGTAA